MAVDKIKVEKQAKELLDKFAKVLEKVESEKIAESHFSREEFERTERNGDKCPEGFRENILKNAPSHDSDFIIAEKGAWK